MRKMNKRGRLLVNIVQKNDQSKYLNVKEYHSDSKSPEESPITQNAITKQEDIFQKKYEENYNNNKQTSPNQQPPLRDENQIAMSTEESTYIVQSLLETRDDIANINTSETKFGKYSVNDYNISSSEESFIEDSDADPTFTAPKKKKKQIIPKVIDCSSSSNTSCSLSSTSSSSSSSDTDDETVADDLVTNNTITLHQAADDLVMNNAITVPQVADDLVTNNIITLPQGQNVVTEECNENSEDVEKRGRKRLQKEETWKVKVAKVLRNSGKPYQSLSKMKKQVPAKKVRAACGTTCRLRCSNNIDENTRQKIFDGYWSLADLQRQREFIVRHAQEIKPKYRYSSTQNLRALNKAFYFEVDGKKIRVCKSFFKATLDLCNTTVNTALSKVNDLGIIGEDLRGKHGKQPKIESEVKDSVVKFINEIPRIESHYLRAQTTREFICSDKSLADLYRDYKDARETKQLPIATASTFNRIFNTEFNISFFIPKKDLCDLCERYKNSIEAEKLKLREEYEKHLIEKHLARDEKESDKNRNDGTIVAVYDLQAVMQVPKGQVSLFFYKSRINCFNFTISDLKAKDVKCFFWDETEGKRGAVEIGSCVLSYINALLEKNPDKDIDIIFYSDNCCGQQKNKFLLSAYAFAVVNKRVKSITHKFLIRGHSQNEGDNVHSVIEKQIKRHVKSGPIYTPQQYSTLIRTAKKTGCPYKVEEMTFQSFYDIKALQEEWGTNFTVDEDRKPIKWHNIKILKVEKDHPTAFFYKTSYADEVYKKAFVQKRRTRTEQIVFRGLTQAYTQKIPLTEAKRKDITELINKNVIPQTYVESYYRQVLSI